MSREDYPDLQSYLRSVRHAQLEQTRLTERVLAMEAQCTRLTAQIRQTPGGGDHDAQLQWAALADERRRLTRQMHRAMRQEREVQTFLDRVKPELYRDILTLRYVDRLCWPEVAAALSRAGHEYSERHILRLHGAALQAAQKVWALEKEKETTT